MIKMNIKNINISDVVVTEQKLPKVVRGLKGIMQLFGVSKTTAWKLKRDVIGDACSQHGRVIECDVCKALELFGMAYPESLVEAESVPPENAGVENRQFESEADCACD